MIDKLLSKHSYNEINLCMIDKLLSKHSYFKTHPLRSGSVIGVRDP